MDDVLISLIGLVVGLAGIGFAIVLTSRRMRAELAREEFHRREMEARLRFLEQELAETGESSERRALIERILSEQARQQYPADWDQVMANGGEPVKVEVGRKDGSTITLGLDPDDPDSVRTFVRDARQSGGDRVLAVR